MGLQGHFRDHVRPHLLAVLVLSLALLGSLLLTPPAHTQGPQDGLKNVGDTCQSNCQNRHAIIFVHGITGNTKDTFRNGTFDWPSKFPRNISDAQFDVYTIQYRSAIISWARANNPNFDELVDFFFDAMKPVRLRPYRSIGFVAHSLGGIVVASYLHEIKALLGHAHRAQNSFLITLGTPRSGSYFANFVEPLTIGLGATNPLLNALKKDNLYLRMSDRLGTWTQDKTTRFGCRPLLVYVGYEKGALIAPMSKESLRRAPPRDAKEFDLSHKMISKPDLLAHPVHRFVEDSIKDALRMMAKFPRELPQLCDQVPYISETSSRGLLTDPLPEDHPWHFLAPKQRLEFLQ